MNFLVGGEPLMLRFRQLTDRDRVLVGGLEAVGIGQPAAHVRLVERRVLRRRRDRLEVVDDHHYRLRQLVLDRVEDAVEPRMRVMRRASVSVTPVPDVHLHGDCPRGL